MVKDYEKELEKLEHKKELYLKYIENSVMRTIKYGFFLLLFIVAIDVIIYLIFGEFYTYGIYIFFVLLLLVPSASQYILNERIQNIDHQLINLRSVSYRYINEKSPQGDPICPNCGGNLISNLRCVACGYYMGR